MAYAALFAPILIVRKSVFRFPVCVPSLRANAGPHLDPEWVFRPESPRGSRLGIGSDNGNVLSPNSGGIGANHQLSTTSDDRVWRSRVVAVSLHISR